MGSLVGMRRAAALQTLFGAALILPMQAQDAAPELAVEVRDARSGSTVKDVRIRLIERFPPEGVPEPRVDDVRSGPDGMARFAGLRPGAFHLRILEAPEAYALEQPASLQIARDTRLELRLGPSVRVRGTIKADRKRFPTVGVHVLQENGDLGISRFVEAAADGTYLLDRLNRDRSVVVTVRSPGAHHRQKTLSFMPDEEERTGVDFSLAPYDPEKISLRGRALLGTTPLSFKGIAVTRKEPLDGVIYSHSTLTDAGGDYMVPDLPPGPYVVQLIQIVGKHGHDAFPVHHVQVPAHGTASVDFLLDVPGDPERGVRRR